MLSNCKEACKLPTLNCEGNGYKLLAQGFLGPTLLMIGKALYRRATCDMTPTRLPVLPAIPFRCENRSRRQHTEAMSVFTAGMPEKLTRVRLHRHTAVKNLRCFLSRRRYFFICWSSIGSIWELGLTQTIPEINTLQSLYPFSPWVSEKQNCPRS